MCEKANNRYEDKRLENETALVNIILSTLSTTIFVIEQSVLSLQMSFFFVALSFSKDIISNLE